MRSRTQSVSQPEQPPRFFLDRRLGRKAVPEALRADGWDVITLAEYYRDELRADLRARAEHAERQADAYRDELAQLRLRPAATPTPPPQAGHHAAPGRPPSRNPPRTRGERHAAHPGRARRGDSDADQVI
jgi:hypothetical protein